MTSTYPDGPKIIDYAQILAFQQELNASSRTQLFRDGFQLGMALLANNKADDYLAGILIANLVPEIAKHPDSIVPSTIPPVEGDSAYAQFTRIVIDLLPRAISEQSF